ncbi:hypothetical protein [Actinomadura oligospora]|uniref:hypothetical protein n=1 Tax=Actinomadura oligospora TaxID=111804 RepID=UPI0004B96917|nr:hypothetical protein [Actinomadura oligospora]
MTLERIGLLAGLLADLRHFKVSARLVSPSSGEPVLMVEAPMSGRWFPVTVTRDAQDRWVFAWLGRWTAADESAVAAARIAGIVR